ncbi:MAG TPA: N-acetylglucosamine-6-phosphate deacetylase [Ktedonobacteraceae bacterium]|jgi:N-acetylglucosamine-6-phosphate deacetylase
MRFTLRGTRLVDATMDLPEGDITIEGTLIEQVGSHNCAPGKVLNASQTIVTPGFIDVHTHGGGGFELHTTNAEQIRSYARWVPGAGVTSFLTSVVGTPAALPEAQLRTAVRAIEEAGAGAQILGIFLEGPYINVKRRGAHPPTWLRQPDPGETELILELTRGHLRLITLAPELPGAHTMIQRLLDAGVTVSIGHTDATYEQTEEAIALGITHATHCFNAMRPLLHRAPGPMAAIAKAPQVLGEVIADGVHVHPEVVHLLVQLLGARRVVAITDAQAGAGQENGATFEFAGQTAQVLCGAAYLADGTLSGSVLTMKQALGNLLKMAQVSLSEAVGMLTLNPARAAGVASCKGRLHAGYDADLLIFDSSLNLQATICRGRLAYATETWNTLFCGY